MTNLSNLFNNGAGAVGSLFTGQQHAVSQQQQQATLAQMLQQNQIEAQMAPVNQQLKEAQLAGVQAQLPGMEAQSRTLVRKDEMDEESKRAQMQDVFLKYASAQGEEGIKSMEREGDVLRGAAAVVSKYPVAAQKQAFSQFAQKYGTVDSPMVKAMMEVEDSQFLKGLQEMGMGMMTASRKAAQERLLRQEENKSQERINKANNDAKIESAEIAARAREAAAKSRLTQASQLSPDKAITMLEMIPEEDRTPAEWRALQKLKEYQYTKGAVRANAVTPGVMGMDSPIEAAKKAAQDERPQAPEAAPSGGDIESALKAQGMQYEPSKYHYRMHNGKVQRAPK